MKIFFLSIWLSAVSLADHYPHRNADGSVSLSSMGIEGDTRLLSCEINSVTIKYIVNQPVCVESVTCVRQSTGFIVNTNTVTEKLYCPTTTERGCRGWSWADCLLDQNIKQEYLDCVLDVPGGVSSNAGCPKVYEAYVPPEVAL